MKDVAIAIIALLNTLQAIADVFSREMFAELGYEADLNLKLGTGVGSHDKLREFIGTTAVELKEIALLGVNPPKSIKGYEPIFTSGKKIYEKLKELQEFDGDSTGTDPDFSDIVEQFGLKIFKKVNPIQYAILDLLNLIEEKEKDTTPKKVGDKFLRFAHKQTRIKSDNVGRPPGVILKETYFSGDGSPDLLIEKIKNLLYAIGIPFAYGIKPVEEIGDLDAKTREVLGRNLSCWFTAGDSLLFGCSFIGLKKDDLAGNPVNDDAPLVLVTPIAALTGFEHQVGNWDFSFAVSESFPAFYFNHEVIRSVAGTNEEEFSMAFGLTKRRGTDGDLAFLFGGTEGTRLEIGKAGLSCRVFLSEQIGEQLKLTLEIEKAKFVLSRGEGDGLLQKLFPEKGMEFSFDFKLNYSNTKGIYFEGQAGTELIIRSGIKLGTIFSVPEIQLGFNFTDSHGLAIYATLSGQTKLGPVSLEIGRTGIQFDLLPKEKGKSAALGFADAEVRFKLPSQIGVVIDAKLIEGGGFLSFNPATGEYVGVVYLTIKRKLEIKAIGIIQTRMPDGSEGFSFLLLITFELPTASPGMGFRLEGIGGLIGINRTIDREALVVGMRDNTLDNILFPDDPVKNAAIIVRQANAVFPPQDDSHTFGIMFLLSWGTRSLVQLKLGLILRYQDPSIIALLGVLKIGVEKTILGKKVVIFKIQVNFKADYEEGKYFAFDANLYESEFLGFQLVGDLCVRWKGSPDPYFLLSAGGFHPDFQPPALNLPKNLQRLKFIIADSEAVKISGYAYLAVTSNTLQFGGGFEAYINVWKLSIEGTLKFDAIYYRTGNPGFKANATGSVKVKIWGFTIGGVTVKGALSGTTPWHFDGSVTFEIGWWDYTKSVEKTWGDESEEISETISLLSLLKDELSVAASWRPVRRRFLQGVSIRPVQGGQAERLLAHPDESLEVQQTVLPLGISIDHYGHLDTSDFRKFNLRLSADNTEIPKKDLFDFFAPAEFFELTQDERLTRKSYDSYNAGVTASGLDDLQGGRFRQIPVTYERKIIGAEEKKTIPLHETHFRGQIRNNAVGRSKTGSRISRTMRSDFGLKQEEFVIVNGENLSPFEPGPATAGSEAAVHTVLKELVREDPRRRAQLTVVARWELNQ